MRDEGFEFWLERLYKTAKGRPLQRQSRQNRLSNCRHVEEYEGDLDDHWRKDRMVSLLKRLEYSGEDETRQAKPRHRIPIDGSIYNGTATLKSALKLYAKFCQARPKG